MQEIIDGVIIPALQMREISYQMSGGAIQGMLTLPAGSFPIEITVFPQKVTILVRRLAFLRSPRRRVRNACRIFNLLHLRAGQLQICKREGEITYGLQLATSVPLGAGDFVECIDYAAAAVNQAVEVLQHLRWSRRVLYASSSGQSPFEERIMSEIESIVERKWNEPRT